MKKTKIVRPILKWVGGKRQLVPILLNNIPANFNNYHEPFMGGAALFFALYNNNLLNKKAYLSDINSELVNTYVAVRDKPKEVIKKLKKHKYEKDYYYSMRSADPSKMSDVDAAARMIYLNKAGFNGMYRVNGSGLFNVPFGKYSNPLICDKDNILAVSKSWQNVEIISQSFEAAISKVKAGDLVYFDPPYVPVSKTSNFVSYAKDGFGEKEQKKLVETAKEIVSRGAFVILSNSNTSWVKENYKDFRIMEVNARRAINSDSKKRGIVKELIIFSY